jgi:hypothetical protein
MLTPSVLALLGDLGRAGINRLARESGEDPRGVRIALMAASAEGLVDVDATFQTWWLTERGRAALAAAAP